MINSHQKPGLQSIVCGSSLIDIHISSSPICNFTSALASKLIPHSFPNTIESTSCLWCFNDCIGPENNRKHYRVKSFLYVLGDKTLACSS